MTNGNGNGNDYAGRVMAGYGQPSDCTTVMDRPPEKFGGTFYRLLVGLKVGVYGGSWEPLEDDLRHRMAGKPLQSKVSERITDDLGRIGEMRAWERETGLDLGDYLEI